jgi:ACS family sodium-dependent inorganic phosphate cotransporter
MKIDALLKTHFFLAHIIPGLFLLSITLLAFNKYMVVAVITLSLGKKIFFCILSSLHVHQSLKFSSSKGFNGAATMTNLQNSQDLAPNFAGSLYGIINFVGTTSGFLTPLIVAHFTEHGVTLLDLHIFLVKFHSHSLYSIQFMIGNTSFGSVLLPTFFLP